MKLFYSASIETLNRFPNYKKDKVRMRWFRAYRVEEFEKTVTHGGGDPLALYGLEEILFVSHRNFLNVK